MALNGRPSDESGNARITRRALLLFGGQTAVGLTLAARMYQLQVLEGQRFQMLSDQNRTMSRLLPPVRGEIFDRNGKALAENRQNFQVLLTPEQTPDIKETLAQLGRLIDLPQHRIDKILRDIQSGNRFDDVLIAENLNWEDFARINANAAAIPGLHFELGWTRHYPVGPAMSHTVGYVGAFSDRDRDRSDAQDPVLSLPGMKIGKSGVERSQEQALRGRAGRLRTEVDVLGRTVRELHRTDGAPGDDLSLTIDLDLQRYAIARFGEDIGAAVVMDIYSGDVLAMASTPNYDPNRFVLGISQSDWNALQRNPDHPMGDKTIGGRYPPGSTFKMMVALAGLRSGAISRGHSVFCNGSMEVGDRVFHCWRRGGHGNVDLRSAIMRSCDVFFYDVAKRVGIDAIAETATMFGIGSAPPIELTGVSAGVMPTKDWKRARYGEAWQTGETLNAGIGQGFVETTPLQLALMTAQIANGGLKVTPRIVGAVNGEPVQPPPLEQMPVERAHINMIREAMNAVTNDKRGTAHRARIGLEGFAMAGKTGTSQVRNISKAERLTGVRGNDQLPRDLRDHALFVAFAPVDRPRLAICVVVEHGGSGSGAAAPIARDILLRAQYGANPPEGAIPADGFPSPVVTLDEAAGDAESGGANSQGPNPRGPNARSGERT